MVSILSDQLTLFRSIVTTPIWCIPIINHEGVFTLGIGFYGTTCAWEPSNEMGHSEMLGIKWWDAHCPSLGGE